MLLRFMLAPYQQGHDETIIRDEPTEDIAQSPEWANIYFFSSKFK